MGKTAFPAQFLTAPLPHIKLASETAHFQLVSEMVQTENSSIIRVALSW